MRNTSVKHGLHEICISSDTYKCTSNKTSSLLHNDKQNGEKYDKKNVYGLDWGIFYLIRVVPMTLNRAIFHQKQYSFSNFSIINLAASGSVSVSMSYLISPVLGLSFKLQVGRVPSLCGLPWCYGWHDVLVLEYQFQYKNIAIIHISIFVDKYRDN